MKTIRLATLLFPPLGLVLLWLAKEIPLRRKILGTFGVGLFGMLYAGGIVALLMLLAGLQLEWRGGFPPVLTWHKTLPDYEAVEMNRKAQAAAPVPQTPAVKAAEWPGFRGPRRDAVYDQTPIATNWPAGGLKPLWKEPVGGGYASFAIAGERAFTIEQRRDKEAVTAYNIETGRELWASIYPADFDEEMGGEGPRATPYFSEGKVYSLGAMGDLLCLDAASGKVIWKVNILADNYAKLLYWGTASSPLVVRNMVIVEPGGPRGACVAAYDKLSGKLIWRSLNDEASYASPMLVSLAGKEQLVAMTVRSAVGLQAEDGKLLWTIPWIVKENNHPIAQPVILGTNDFLLSAGYGTGCEEVEISKSASGFEARPLWHNTNLKNKFASSVFWQGFVYGLDEDMLVCLEPKTGERKWKDGRYGYGQIVLAGGYIIVLSGDGQLALVKAQPDRYEEVGRFQAIEGKTWNHPAMAGGKILVRNAVQMACFDLKAGK